MKSAYIHAYFTLLLIAYHHSSYGMDPYAALQATKQFFNPSLPESQRSIVGSLLRATLKRINTTEMDLDIAGLNQESERRITLAVYEKIDKSPTDLVLQKQFLDRQRAVAGIAFNLIGELNAFNTNPDESAVSETLGAIKISMQLRKIHARQTLSPLINRQLLEATNKARQNITKTLRVQLDDENSILKIETQLDEETLALAKKIMQERGFQVFGATPEEENRLIERAQAVCKKKKPPSQEGE